MTRGIVVACLCSLLLPATTQAAPRNRSSSLLSAGQGGANVRASAYAQQQGISLSQAEIDLQLQDQAGDIAGQLEQTLGSTYAGLWFEAEHGRFHVDLAPGTDRRAAEEVVSGLGVASATLFDSVAHTWPEVEATADALLRQLAPYGASVAVITSPQRNAPLIEVAANASDPAVSAADTAAAAATIPATVVQVPARELTASSNACNFPNCDAPIKGGVWIRSTADPERYYNACTAGVEVEDANHYDYVLTAGHCFSGSPYYNYPYNWRAAYSNGQECELGPPIASELSTKGDAGVIAGPRGCGALAAQIVEWGVIENYPVHAQAKAYVGLFMCHMGEHSENQCGTVETANVATTIKYSVGKIRVEHTDRMCALSLPGDSGGPTQYGNLEWTYVTGILIAGNEEAPASCSEGARSWDYELEYAEKLIGVTVVKGF